MEPTVEGLVQYITDRSRIWAEKYLYGVEPDYAGDQVLKNYMFTNVWRELDAFSKSEIKLTRNLALHDQMLVILIGRTTLSWPTAERMLSPITEAQLRKYWQDCIKNGTKFMGNALSFYPSKGHDRAWELWTFKKNVVKHLDKFVFMAYSINTGIAQPWDLMELFKEKLNRVGNFRAYEFYTSLTYSKNLNFTEYDVKVIGPGAINMLKKLAPSGKTPEEKLEALRVVVKEMLEENPEFRWIPSELQPGLKEEHKFTPRTMEDCLCEYRKYVNLSNGIGRRRIYRRSAQ